MHLGYIVIESEKFSDWRRFGREAIGMHLDDTLSDTIRFRLDENECRFLVQRGPAEDVIALGWEVDDHETFETVVSRITAHGVPITDCSSEEAALRGVERLVRFPGPNGLDQEVFTRARKTPEPLDIGVSSFVTGEFGLGHVAVTSKKPHEMRGYYNTVFDARLSDYIDETISGARLKIRFLRVNRRHHSVAIASVNQLPLNPIRTRVQHINIQVDGLDDMTDAYQRVKALDFDIALGIGQHTNDRELSFYALSPSGFEWEVGWNPLIVDENTWKPNTLQGISIWGHKPEDKVLVSKLAQFGHGLRSVWHREDTVPALSGAGIPDNEGH